MSIWHNETILTDEGHHVEAECPLIVSASRATDIPAFYCEWFFRRLEKGYIRRVNPFNGRSIYIVLATVRVVVFWSKNPAPLIPYLSRLDEKNIGYYIHYTLNDYGRENFEPNIPDISFRMDTFRRLSDLLGPDRLIWRFDPLMLSADLGSDDLLDRIDRIASVLSGYTRKLVFSFADISGYRKVERNLRRHGISFREFSSGDMLRFVRRLSALPSLREIETASCSETMDFSEFGVHAGKCIDDKLMARLFSEDRVLMRFLRGQTPLKDRGQRKACRCIYSKDIGRYSTCPHLCVYCYANHGPHEVGGNYRVHDPDGDCI